MPSSTHSSAFNLLASVHKDRNANGAHALPTASLLSELIKSVGDYGSPHSHSSPLVQSRTSQLSLDPLVQIRGFQPLTPPPEAQDDVSLDEALRIIRSNSVPLFPRYKGLSDTRFSVSSSQLDTASQSLGSIPISLGKKVHGLYTPPTPTEKRQVSLSINTENAQKEARKFGKTRYSRSDKPHVTPPPSISTKCTSSQGKLAYLNKLFSQSSKSVELTSSTDDDSDREDELDIIKPLASAVVCASPAHCD